MRFCAKSNQFAASSHSSFVTQTEVCAFSTLPIHAVICLGPGGWMRAAAGVAKSLSHIGCLRPVAVVQRLVAISWFPSCHQTKKGVLSNVANQPVRTEERQLAARQHITSFYQLASIYKILGKKYLKTCSCCSLV